MSVITSYTITCDRKLDAEQQCPKVIGPHPSLWQAQEEAERAGWKLDYRLGPIPTGDRCPDHVAPLDRVRWD